MPDAYDYGAVFADQMRRRKHRSSRVPAGVVQERALPALWPDHMRSLRPRTGPTAAERLAAVRERILARGLCMPVPANQLG